MQVRNIGKGIGERACDAIDPVIEAMQWEIFHRAEAAAEAYWAESKRRRKLRDAEPPAFALYIEQKAAGVSMYYQRQKLIRTKKRWLVRSSHVKVGGRQGKSAYKYAATKVKAAPEWEQRMIEDVEEILAPLRRASAYLARVAKTARSHEGRGIPCEPMQEKVA